MGVSTGTAPFSLIDGSITTAKLANGAATQAKITADYLLSNDVLHSHDTAEFDVHTTYTKVKQITLAGTDTIRMSFDLKTSDGADTAYGRIYKNGVAFGTEQTETSTSYVSKSEDLAFSDGDTIELWTKTNSATGKRVDVENFRILGTAKTLTTNITGTNTFP